MRPAPSPDEAALAKAPVGLAVFDPEGCYISVNTELAYIDGLPAEDHPGRSLLDVVPGLGEALLDVIREVHRTGREVPGLELRGETRRRPGVVRDWRWGFYPYRNGAGVPGVGARVQDVTDDRHSAAEASQPPQEQREALAALEARRLRLQLGIQAAGLMMAEIDYRSDVNHISGELARLLALGDGPMSVPRQAIFDRIHPDDRERYLQAIRATVDPAGGGHLAIDVRALLPDGEQRWLHIRLQVTFTQMEGRLRPNRGICAARDTTAEALADRHKDAFIATLAHELRNPLAPLRTGLEILKRVGGLPPPAVRTRDMMERQLNHMVRLVDDLLDVSRISRDRLELRLEPVTLAQVVELAVETCQPSLQAADHELVLQLPPDRLTVHGDLTRLAQVVGNLLHNAIKYTPAGGRIALRAWREGGEAALEVADTGAGISGPMLQQVFDLFAQGDRPGGAQSGLGIGLWLVRKLVELHHGRIAARSAGPGLGSTFTLHLPLMDHPNEKETP